MTLETIAIFALMGIAYSLFLPAKWRAWFLFVASVIAIYWIQPSLDIRRLDFALPTVTIGLAVMGWWLTRSLPDGTPRYHLRTGIMREDMVTLVVTVALVLGLTLPRYFAIDFGLTTRPPDVLQVIIFMLGGAFLAWSVTRITGKRVLTIALLLIIGLFVLVKTAPLTEWLAGFLRTNVGQDASLATALQVEWLGFSYVAFRLIHTLRDRQMGRLPDLRLREYLTFIIFFPAYTAGPIDKAERWTQDWQALPDLPRADADRLTQAGMRIAIGLFKKFIIADSLALFALDAIRAEQAMSTPALWLLLYAYAFRLYFDFSGYSDIAIGIGMLFGIQLPENFNRPYLKNNIASFWQAWHMTLSNWVRAYVFSPLSRALIRRKPKPPNELIQLVCHLSTMMVIGLWHGVTWAFLLWGVWHGLGLFVHKIWTDRTRKWYISLKDKPRTKRAWTIVGVFMTFHFVALGWVWFALPDVGLGAQTMLRLLGIW
jgi:alginate O-acetyltransferase complex protein AlgI